MGPAFAGMTNRFVTSSDLRSMSKLYREVFLLVLDTKLQKSNFTRTDVLVNYNLINKRPSFIASTLFTFWDCTVIWNF